MITNKSVLEHVDLSQNFINKLKVGFFYEQPNLKHIILRRNGLREVAFDLSRSPNLRFLDLSNNLITSLKERTMAMFDNIAKISNLTIDMYNNPLSCNCGTLPFLIWMTKTRVRFIHLRQYRCVLDDGSEVTLNTLKEIIHQQQKDYVSYSDILIGSTISAFTVIVLLLSALVYKYRWKLRYMCYLTKSKHYSYKASNDDVVDYSYHSFISYSDNDRSFVIKDCITNLEKDGEFKLCVHQRDFLPGQDISVNITNAIHESRKTICIITKTFF
ncbi:unnamed protein product [Mytilus coruscus]|uniref:TIR domain-containing protein n=1 Tax=Mytilus coruscus TaxID=42192 RepID=A0A6J8A6V4_MYTCO|nr:unnamed protein product [Mytilus coruscus]